MNQLNSLQLAAVLLKSLPADQASSMIDRLDPPELRSVFNAAKSITQVSTEDLERTLDALELASRDLEEFDKEEATAALTDPGLPIYETDGLFDFLEESKLSLCQRVLEDEHPRNIAIALTHLTPKKASEILNGLETPQRVSVLKRLCEQDIESDQEANELRFILKMRLQKILSNDSHKNCGIEIAAKVLSCTEPDLQNNLLEYINQEDPDLARNLEASIFQFDDLQKLSDDDIDVLLKNVNTSLWAPALRIADFATQSKVLKNMGDAPATILNREIAYIDFVDNTAALRAQKQIINTLLTLKQQGKLGE